MNSRTLVAVYAFTLLTSAALLFSVQPMFSKMILPLLGGTPQVWNTAMMFFQLCLLAGYAYAHFSSRYLKPSIQALIQVGLLIVFGLALPFSIPEQWYPSENINPALWQLGVMTATIGGPFFILASAAPMLQRWYANTNAKDSDNPYFLYGASNLGSMSALLAYPFLIEPFADLSQQSYVWYISYYLLILCVAACGILVTRNKKPATLETTLNTSTSEVPTLSARNILYWFILAFLPSSLMLGVTTHITTDIASVPLLWILPLSLYIGTFILVFARKPIFSIKSSTLMFEIAIIILCAAFIVTKNVTVDTFFVMFVHLATFFCAALFCHTLLAQSRPHHQHLTAFYLTMSAGGALGGVMNALIAPVIFVTPIEYPLILLAIVCMRYSDVKLIHFEKIKSIFKLEGLSKTVFRMFESNNLYVAIIFFSVCFLSLGFIGQYLGFVFAFIIVVIMAFAMHRRWFFSCLTLIVLLLFPAAPLWQKDLFSQTLHQERNFFGVLSVTNHKDEKHILQHGTTFHGAQLLAPQDRLTKVSYYGPKSPLSDVFDILDKRIGDQRIATLGLGVGTVACYTKAGRHFDFFEIDPAVVRIAENPEYFTYLRDCKSPYSIILGDARFKLNKQENQPYDLIIADAFSSDNIPVHLLTREAMMMYLQKLKPNGILVFNISNKYIDMEPVLGQTAIDLGLQGLGKIHVPKSTDNIDSPFFGSHYFAIAKTPEIGAELTARNWSPAILGDNPKGWSDQYSNLVGAISRNSAIQREKDQGKIKE